MSALREAAQQALEALKLSTPKTRRADDDYAEQGWTEHNTAITALRAALAQEQAEPDLSRCPQCNGPADNGHDRSIPPNPYLCTKCMAEPVAGIIEPRIKGDSHQTLDDAMRLPRAMAQAYERGYKAGQAHERERIIQFLQEMQRVVGDAHNHYGVAAVRIKEGV